MPKPVLTLWIVNAVTLPVVCLGIALTPKHKALPDNSPSQLAVPDQDLSQKKPNPTPEPFSPSVVQSPPPSVAPAPKPLKLVSAPPARPTISSVSPAVAPKPVVVAAKAFSLPKKSQPAFVPSSQSVVSLRLPQEVAPQPFFVPAVESIPEKPVVTTTPSPAATIPTPPESVAPALPQAVPEASPAPENEPPSAEVESLCQKFPLNSRCKNAFPLASLEAFLAPEREPSPEEIESLCQKFPLNSRCEDNAIAPDASTPNVTPTPSEPRFPESSSPVPSTTKDELGQELESPSHNGIGESNGVTPEQ